MEMIGKRFKNVSLSLLPMVYGNYSEVFITVVENVMQR
jgi:hypothetical protein